MVKQMRKDRVKNWLKDRNNLILILILVIAFGIRIYYFAQTTYQPLWWDEAAYGSLAKNHISGLWDGTDTIDRESTIRPPLFSYIWAFLITVGSSEPLIRFLLEFIPSMLSVLLIYHVGKEFYNKQVGLVAAFTLSFLWIHLFYSLRLLTDVPALFFVLASLLYFAKATKADFNKKYFAISIAILSIGTLIRYPIGILFICYAVFLLLTHAKLLRDPKAWMSGILGLLPLILFFLVNYFSSGSLFPSISSGYVSAVGESFAFSVLKYIPVYLNVLFFSAFIVGTLYALAELFLGYDQLKKSTRIKGHLLFTLLGVIFLGYFIFYLKGAEDRWLLPVATSLLMFVALGTDLARRTLAKYSSEKIAVIALILFLVAGTYMQMKTAHPLIENRKESFLQMRQGFEWIQLNTPEDAIILGNAIQVYTIYYAERMYLNLPQNATALHDLDADYLVVHAFTEQPSYINDYLTQNQARWKPVRIYFFDQQQTQPALIIYQKV